MSEKQHGISFSHGMVLLDPNRDETLEKLHILKFIVTSLFGLPEVPPGWFCRSGLQIALLQTHLKSRWVEASERQYSLFLEQLEKGEQEMIQLLKDGFPMDICLVLDTLLPVMTQVDVSTRLYHGKSI
jgi:hypothetical protein